MRACARASLALLTSVRSCSQLPPACWSQSVQGLVSCACARRLPQPRLTLTHCARSQAAVVCQHVHERWQRSCSLRGGGGQDGHVTCACARLLMIRLLRVHLRRRCQHVPVQGAHVHALDLWAVAWTCGAHRRTGVPTSTKSPSALNPPTVELSVRALLVAFRARDDDSKRTCAYLGVREFTMI